MMAIVNERTGASTTPYNLPAGATPRPAVWADVPDEQWNDWR
jgi:hypothetical protein